MCETHINKNIKFYERYGKEDPRKSRTIPHFRM